MGIEEITISKSVLAKVPCKFCNVDTTNTGSKMCDNCWEIESRIYGFIQHEKGRTFLKDLLQKRENV